MLISSNIQKLGSLLNIYIINILNYFKTLQESQHNTPTLNGNPQYQNAIISPIKVPNSSPTSNVAYTQVLALFPFSNNPTRNIFHANKMKEQGIATIWTYATIYIPKLEFTSTTSNSTKQLSFLSYSIIITPHKTLELINLTQEKENFNLPQNPFSPLQNFTHEFLLDSLTNQSFYDSWGIQYSKL